MSDSGPDCPDCPDCGSPLRGGISEGMCVVCLLGAGASLTVSGGRRKGGDPEFPIEFGDYDLLEEIGHGGSGRVFRARHRHLGRQVAIKILSGGGLASRDFVERFRNEARAAAGLSHPFIVPVYEVGEHEGQSFLVMRLLEGGSLAKQLAENPRRFSDGREAAGFISTLARAVHFAHRHGVLHRDLKPGNVLLDAGGQPYVTDFGLARLTEQESALTRTNAMLGTPGYMAPEQARGGLPVTTAADVYGIGAVLYEMLTGLPPFAGGTTYETVRMLLNTEVRRPTAIVPGLDRDVETICLKCLAKEPAARYSSAETLANDLDRHLRGEPIHARPVSTFVRFQKWVNRHRALSVASAAAVASLFGGVTLLALTNAKLRETQRVLARQTGQQRRDLIRLRVDTGNRQAEEGDGYAALVSFAEAAALDGDSPERLAEHRFRFAATLALLPDLRHSWRHGSGVLHAAFSRDDRRVVTAAGDHKARVFDTASGRELTPPLPHATAVWSAAFAGGDSRIITRTVTGDVHLWQADTGAPAAGPFRGRGAMDWLDGLESTVEVSRDGGTFALLLSNKVELRGVENGELRSAPVPCPEQPSAAVFSPDGRRLAIVCERGPGQIFDLTARPPALVAEFRGQSGWRTGTWTADGKRLAMTDCNFGVGIFNGVGDSLKEGFSNAAMALGCAWSAEGDRILSWSYDNAVRIWDAGSGRPVLAVMRHAGPAFSAGFQPGGTLIASGGFDGARAPVEFPHRGAARRAAAPRGPGAPGDVEP